MRRRDLLKGLVLSPLVARAQTPCSPTLISIDNVPIASGDTCQLGTGWPAQKPAYLPVVPNVASFGANQYAGSGRHPTSGAHTVNQTYVMYVDRLDTGTVGGSTFGSTNNAVNTAERVGFGSVKWCLTKSLGPNVSRVVVPLVTGVIDFQHLDDSYIRMHAYTTLAWQTAPQPGLFLQDIQLYSGPVTNPGSSGQSGQMLLWHVPIFHSHDPVPMNSLGSQGYTCISDDVLYANCMIAWQQDEGFLAGPDSQNPARRVGYWQCVVLEPVADDIEGINSGHGFFFDKSASDISMLRCATIKAWQRSPICRTVGNISIVNHLVIEWDYYNNGGTATFWHGSGTRANIEQSLFVRGPNAKTNKRPIYRDPTLWDPTNSVIYADKVRQLHVPWDERDWVSPDGVDEDVDPLATQRIAAAYPTGYVPFDLGKVGSTGVDDHRAEFGNLLLDHLGPRPTQRLATFQQPIDQAKNLIALNGGDYGIMMQRLSEIAARIPTVSQTSISDPYAPQETHWGMDPSTGAGRRVPRVSENRDVPYTSGTFSDGMSRVGYTRLEEFLYELHLRVMP